MANNKTKPKLWIYYHYEDMQGNKFTPGYHEESEVPTEIAVKLVNSQQAKWVNDDNPSDPPKRS